MLSPNRIAAGGTSSLRDKNAALRARNWPPQFYQHRKSSTADRFIPQRRHRNLDAMNYNLRRVPPPSNTPDDFDLFGQIASLETTWRKKLMKKAIERAEAIPGVKDRKVLNFAERENQTLIPDVAVRDDLPDAMWKSKTRSKPLIDHGTFTMSLERSRNFGPETIDWGAKNFLATVIDTWTASSVVIFNADVNNTGAITKPGQTLVELRSRVQAIVWNYAGDRIAMVDDASNLKVASMEKHCWSRKCPCVEETSGKRCTIDCVAWTHNDKEIAICCSESRVTAFTYSGQLIQSVFAALSANFSTSISFSSNDRYFAITGFSTTQIYTWPSLIAYFEIGRHLSEYEKPMAWHPWNANVLCVGCCPMPNALTVWDVHRQRLLGCKRALSAWKVEQIAWNKLSGELVVRWDYWVEDQCKSVVTVLASLDRVVDAVYEKFQSSGLVWNPDATLLAVRRRSQIKIWKFFGDDAKKWSDQKDEKTRSRMESLKRRRAIYTDQTRHLEHYNIH